VRRLSRVTSCCSSVQRLSARARVRQDIQPTIFASISWGTPWVVRARTTSAASTTTSGPDSPQFQAPGAIADGAAERYKALPTLIMHGAKDSIVPPATSRRAVAALQAVGAPHIYLEFPDKDHEFWIRRGAAQMEKVFLFFSLVSKRTTVLPEK
jgi:alpha-beta hydrolase superfamily lysophospholipase